MKIVLNKGRLAINPDFFLRRAGYGQISSYHTGKTSYVRRFSRDHYPRFHMYFEDCSDKIIFNLHLDQKQVSYEGADHAHNAEHDGPVVENEIDRLKNLLKQFAASGQTGYEGMTPGGSDWEKDLTAELVQDSNYYSGKKPVSDNGGVFKVGEGQSKNTTEKKSFFRKIFGI